MNKYLDGSREFGELPQPRMDKTYPGRADKRSQARQMRRAMVKMGARREQLKGV